uniref:Uncharacterized protein n=1 Tax=Ditylenchus dipsaci TaxID=166011 RepID=A0A915DEE2_9BILA
MISRRTFFCAFIFGLVVYTSSVYAEKSTPSNSDCVLKCSKGWFMDRISDLSCSSCCQNKVSAFKIVFKIVLPVLASSLASSGCVCSGYGI